MQIGMDSLQNWFFSLRQKGLPGYPQEYVMMTSHGRADIKLSEILEDGFDPNLVLTWAGAWYGSVELRQRVLETYQHKDMDIENILISTGSNGANFTALQSILEPGDEVVIQMPSWMQGYMVTKYLLKCNIKILYSTQEENWKINLDKLNEMVTPKTKMIWIVSPTNPTGLVISEKEMRGIIDIARANGVWVLQDSINRGLEWEGGLAPAVCDMYEKGVTTGGTTKALGVTGIRVGWIISPDKNFILNCNNLQTYVTLCNSWPGELIATELMKPEKWKRIVEQGKAIGRHNMPLVEQWLSKHKDKVSWVKPIGTYLGFPRYNYDISSWNLCEKALDHKVILGPGIGFMTERHFRLGFGIETELLNEGLRRMDALIDDLDRSVPITSN